MSATAVKARKHALSGSGPIVDRARRALRGVAEQFGDVTGVADTSVDVTTPDGIALVLSYEPGNYIFSRVYNLTVSTALPDDSPLPEAKLTYRGREGGPRYASPGDRATPALRRLNQVAAPHLAGIDMHSSRVTDTSGTRTLTVTPLGGSYVWVLIPPVFKATAFPPGEPGRLLDLIRAVRDIRGACVSLTCRTESSVHHPHRYPERP